MDISKGQCGEGGVFFFFVLLGAFRIWKQHSKKVSIVNEIWSNYTPAECPFPSKNKGWCILDRCGSEMSASNYSDLTRCFTPNGGEK